MPITTGWMLRQDNDPDGARASFDAAQRISRRSGYLSDLAYASPGLACVAADLGDPRRAAELHGAAQAILDHMGEPWPEPEARYRRDGLHKVATTLGQEQFQRAYAKGTALSLDKALALASGKAQHQGRPPRVTQAPDLHPIKRSRSPARSTRTAVRVRERLRMW